MCPGLATVGIEAWQRHVEHLPARPLFGVVGNQLCRHLELVAQAGVGEAGGQRHGRSGFQQGRQGHAIGQRLVGGVGDAVATVVGQDLFQGIHPLVGFFLRPEVEAVEREAAGLGHQVAPVDVALHEHARRSDGNGIEGAARAQGIQQAATPAGGRRGGQACIGLHLLVGVGEQFTRHGSAGLVFGLGQGFGQVAHVEQDGHFALAVQPVQRRELGVEGKRLVARRTGGHEVGTAEGQPAAAPDGVVGFDAVGLAGHDGVVAVVAAGQKHADQGLVVGNGCTGRYRQAQQSGGGQRGQTQGAGRLAHECTAGGMVVGSHVGFSLAQWLCAWGAQRWTANSAVMAVR